MQAQLEFILAHGKVAEQYNIDTLAKSMEVWSKVEKRPMRPSFMQTVAELLDLDLTNTGDYMLVRQYVFEVHLLRARREFRKILNGDGLYS
jgi:hypothetical protein